MPDHDDLERDIDRLYALSLADFTAARNEAAKRLQLSGDADGAARVKALAKPSVSAWAVNQLHHRAGDELEGLYEAGDRLRAAQAGASSRQEHQEAAQARRDAVTGLAERAAALLEESGAAPAEATRRRVMRTLEALAAYPRGALPDPGPGRLVADLEPPGFEALAGLALQPKAVSATQRPATTAAAPDSTAKKSKRRPTKRELARAEAAAEQAKETVARARAEARRARTSARRAERGHAKALAEAEEAERLASTRRRKAEELAARVRSLAAELEQADDVVAEAEKALEAANEQQSRLKGRA